MDKDLLKTLTQDLNKVTSKNDLMNLKSKFLGKKGLISELTSELKNLSIDEKKNRGAEINSTKKDIEIAIGKKLKDIEEAEINKKLNSEKIDITLPGKAPAFGSLHPITQVLENVIDIFEGYGFQTVEGPEVENNFYNFEALNIPENHPAREMHDTFYIENNLEKLVLRTHTSPVQIRNLQKKKFPLRIFAPGRTYRCDSDITHTPMFHQVEGLVVDHSVTFANLKWFLEKFCKVFFDNEKLKLRFRPSYFPFTEPSAEVDVNCSITSGKIILGEGDKWMEILGCGMVHPNVLKMSGVDDDQLKGFAFGMGIERLSMLKYGMPDLRDFYDSNINWLSHYGFSFLETTDLSWR